MSGGKPSTTDVLRLSDDSGTVREFRLPEVRIGRDPACEWCIETSGSVSAVHARITFRDGGWWLADNGSRNGTFFGDRRLAPEESVALRSGVSFRLAAAGPAFRVVPAVPLATMIENAGGTLVDGSLDAGATLLVGDATALMSPAPVLEMHESAAAGTTRAISRPGALTARERAMANFETAPAPAPAPAATVPVAASTSAPDWSDPVPPAASRVFAVFNAIDTQQHFALTGSLARIGRAPECEFRLSVTDASVVSRVHAELRVEAGVVQLSDKGSSFGTFVNGGQLTAPRDIAPGDLIQLGATGPRLVATEVNGVRAPDGAVAAARLAPAAPPTAVGASPAKGMTLFVKRLAEEAARSSTRRLRLLLLGAVASFAIALVAIQLASNARARETESELARQRDEAERVRQESRELRATAAQDAARLRAELERARQASAPRATVDSLQRSLQSAVLRTGAMEASFARAGSTLRSQLAAIDSLRRRSDDNLTRLRGELARAQVDPRARPAADSLQRAVDEAQRQLTMYDAQFRTLQSVAIAGAAEGDQRAIGQAVAYRSGKATRSSGFIISASGYFLAARDALGAEAAAPDSIVVAFGEPSRRWTATVASVSRAKALDVVVLKLRDYDGPHLRRLDWAGTRGAVNEPAAIIGHPIGEVAARPGVSAAIISRSAPDRMRLEVFGTPSSNGSAVFAASGEVIGMLQLALPREGVAYAARLYRVIPILPPELQAELGVRP